MTPERHPALFGIFFAALLIASAAPRSNAEEPTAPANITLQLRAPVDCEAVGGCFIQNYVDLDPGPEARDYRCGGLTYDGHKGVDFAVRDLAAMRKGVPVLAPASGTVLRIRDHEPDGIFDRNNKESVAGRECGNGMVIYHRDGWETQLCHLREGSINVAVGDRVEAGQSVGLVGQSGRAEFPHVHLTLRHNRIVFDPFTGLDRSASCGQEEAGLWESGSLGAYPYKATEIIRQGFASKRPTRAEIVAGQHYATEFPHNTDSLYFWASVKGLKGGDVIVLRIFNAAGKPIVRQRYKPLDRDKARVIVIAGGKPRSGRLRPGAYRGDLEVIRDGADGGFVAFRSGASMMVR